MTTATATKTTSLGPMHQVDAGVLNVGYAEAAAAARDPRLETAAARW